MSLAPRYAWSAVSPIGYRQPAKPQYISYPLTDGQLGLAELRKTFVAILQRTLYGPRDRLVRHHLYGQRQLWSARRDLVGIQHHPVYMDDRSGYPWTHLRSQGVRSDWSWMEGVLGIVARCRRRQRGHGRREEDGPQGSHRGCSENV